MQQPIIALDNLRTHYGKQQIFQGLNLTLRPGMIHGLIGANGEGKTTLMRVLAGQLNYQGSAKVFGHDPFDNQQVLDRVVFMGIDVPLPDQWTLQKILNIGKMRWPNWDDAIAEDVITRLRLPQGKSYKTLSRGQRSAVGVVLALASQSELVLFDEPYLGFDLSVREQFFALLREHNTGERTFVLSTHHITEAENSLDALTLLSGGKVVLSSEIEQLEDRFFTLTGTAAAVSKLSAQVQFRARHTQEQAGYCNFIVDMHECADSAEAFMTHARACNLTIAQTPIEDIVKLYMERN